MRIRSQQSALARVLLLTTLTLLFSSLSIAAAEKRRFDIAAGEARHTLHEFSRQSDLQIFFDADVVRALKTNAVAGELDAADALSKMLGGTGLVFEFVNDRTIAVRLAGRETRASMRISTDAIATGAANAGQSVAPVANVNGAPTGTVTTRDASSTSESSSGADSQFRGLPEYLVRGSKVLNMDIRRTEDDAQPYVVFTREEIARSAAVSVDDFLRMRLTSAGIPQTSAQTEGGNNSSIVNLRGLGSEQTLILVDGHRTASQNNRGIVAQADLNGIPLAAVERIEVLPATASGIYGGGATGGVVNVVLRRDYAGLETKLTYENSFDGGGATRRVDLASGINLEGGRTTILLAGSYSDGTDLMTGDRDFLERGRDHQLLNNPAAVFGLPTPPLGATTNIRSTTGANLTLKPQFGSGSLGSPFTFVPIGYAGPASDSGAALIANAGDYNLAGAETVQARGGDNQSLVNSPTIKSLMATFRRGFTPWLQAYVDVAGSENAGEFTSNFIGSSFTLNPTSPANPFNEQIRITTPALGTDLRGRTSHKNEKVVGGFILDLPKDWRASAAYTWNRTRVESTLADLSLIAAATTAVSNGVTAGGETFNVFRDVNAFPVDYSQFVIGPSTIQPLRSRLTSTAVRIAGPFGRWLPGGAPTLSLLLERRKDSLDEFSITAPSTITVGYDRSQMVDSIYLDALAPLVSPENDVPLVHMLELQLAGRRDQYEIIGANNETVLLTAPIPPPVHVTRKLSSSDPMTSLRYQPIAGVTIRGSYGTGFMPPPLHRLVPGPTAQLPAGFRGLTDPQRNNQLLGPITLLGGGNPDLLPEESTSRSLGLVLVPRFAPGLRVSVDWTEIEKRDNLSVFTLTQANVNNESLVPGLITRGPPSGGFSVGPILSFSQRSINIARQDVQALDVAIDYRWKSSRWGTFGFSAAGTRNQDNEIQVLTSLPELDSVGTSNLLEWKAYAGIEWDSRSWTAVWDTTYIDSYCLLTACATGPVTLSQGSERIPSQIYHDLAIGYRFASAEPSSFLANTEIRLGVKNVFDKDPPVDVTRDAFYSTLGDPRLRRYFLSLRKEFF